MAALKNPLELSNMIQIGIIVKDIHKARKEWSDLLGIPEPEISVEKKPDGPIEGLDYRGKEASYGLLVAEIKAPQGFIIELHQLTDDCDSTFREFVEKHGYGVHHIGFKVGDKRDDIVQEMMERGYDTRTVGFYPGGSWTIMDTEDALGVNLNIKPRP